jgi:hypothetical protein
VVEAVECVRLHTNSRVVTRYCVEFGLRSHVFQCRGSWWGGVGAVGFGEGLGRH